MIETLLPAYTSRLHDDEKVQLVARMISEIESSKVRIADEEVKKLIARLKGKLTNFQSLQEPVRRSKHTDKLKEADEMRDADVRALFASLRAYSSSKRTNEKEAYKSLQALVKLYKDVTHRNYEEETVVIARLLTQLKSDTYSADVTTLNLTPLVTRLTESQTQFESLFTAKVKSELAQPKVNHKQLRDELFEEYLRFCQYIDVMVWAKGTELFTKLLAIINNGRKYFAEVIHKRTGRSKKQVKKVKEVEESTPQVEEVVENTDDTHTNDTEATTEQEESQAES